MSPKELRIGNNAYRKDLVSKDLFCVEILSIYKCNNTKKMKVSTFLKGGSDVIVNTACENLKPISISLEIMDKMGFENCGEKRDYGIEFFKSGVFFYLVGSEFRYYTHLNRSWISIESVHEIQNIFYFMSGGKEVKLPIGIN